jgi:xylulokinase
MARQLLLGIDVGTQGTRVALIDQAGRVQASANTAYDTSFPRPGWAEQDPEIWWNGALSGIRQVLAQAAPVEVQAVGVDAQMHAAIPLGRQGQLLSHAMQLWCDKRAGALAQAFKARPGAAAAMRQAGNPPAAAWLGFKIRWLKQREPELYRQTWQFVTGAAFINYRLTGQIAMDWSEASGSYLLDVNKLDWSPELAQALEVDLNKLPPVLPSYQPMGKVSRQAAALSGLAPGTPVVAGAGDMLCMLLASGLTEPGRALDISGTASDLVFYLDRPLLEPLLTNLHHAAPGWCPFGIVDAGGGSVKWFLQTLCRAEIQAAQESGQDVFDLLTPQAARVEPGSEGLLFLPYLMGERSLGTPNGRGVFFGLTPRSHLGAMFRAVLEGVTFDLSRTLEIVEGAGHRITEVYTSGGGARNDLWSQIKADIYQKPVYTLAADEGGVLGAAILAGVGCGLFADIPSAARQCVRVGRQFLPNPATFTAYQALFSLFKEVHDQLQGPFDRLAAIAFPET